VNLTPDVVTGLLSKLAGGGNGSLGGGSGSQVSPGSAISYEDR